MSTFHARTIAKAADRLGLPVDLVTGELYDTANNRIIRETFEKLFPHPVAYLIYGAPGNQKSFVAERQVARFNETEMHQPHGRCAFYIYVRDKIRPRDLMCRIAVACGCKPANDIDTMLSAVRNRYRNHRGLLLFDEANHLSIDCLEMIRELLDQPPRFSVLLMGSHDLKRRFDEFSASLEQWNSRIIAKVRLPGLERPEAVGIIHRELDEVLEMLPPSQVEAMIDKLIQGATVRDAFEGDANYINIRTLVCALSQIKINAAAQL